MTSQAGVKNLKVPWRGPCEESLSTSDATPWLAFMCSSANFTHSARLRPTSVLTGGIGGGDSSDPNPAVYADAFRSTEGRRAAEAAKLI